MEDLNTNFLGTGWSFPPTFKKGGKNVDMVMGEDDIMQSLEILLSTNFKERFYHTDFGCDLNRFVFEEVDRSLVNQIKSIVTDTITRYETRINLNKVEINAGNDEVGKIYISLVFTIRTTNTRYNMVYPFYIIESANNP